MIYRLRTTAGHSCFRTPVGCQRSVMFFRLLFLLTAIPLTELLLLVWITHHTSLWWTLLLVSLTGLVGAWLVRWQSWWVVERVRGEISRGRAPTDSLLDGVLIFLAAVVLITPGVLTDFCGLLLLVPPNRRIVRWWLRKKFQAHFTMDSTGFQSTATGPDNVTHDKIVEARVIDGSSDGPNKPAELED